MNVVTIREPSEQIHIDTQQLNSNLASNIPEITGDRVFHMADAMAQVLGEAETNFLSGQNEQLIIGLAKISQLAQKFGFLTILHVAKDVEYAVRINDQVAASATLHRLLRIGEKSLYAIWDMPERFV